VSRSYGPGRYDPEYERRGPNYPIGYVRWTEQRNMEAVLDLQARGLIELQSLVDEVMDVDRAPEAYDRLVGPADGRPKGAIVLAYPEAEDRPEPRPPTRAKQPAAPDRPPAIGLIGAGEFARAVLVPAFREAGARLGVVGGGAGPSADQAQRLWGFDRVAAGPRELVADEGIDAVVIAAPHGVHAELAAMALRAGKHVFCEKPLALTTGELDDVMTAADRSSGILMVGYNRRFSPLLVELRDFLREPGGSLLVNYRVSAGAIPPDHWVHDLATGGGRVHGEVCHFLDALQFLTGARITDVHAAGFARDGQPLQARDNVLLTVGLSDGSVGSIAYAAVAAPGVGKERIEAFAQGRIGVLDDYRALELHEGAKRSARRGRAQAKGHAEEVRAFLAGMRSGVPPIPPDDLANVTRATIASIESLRTGLPVRAGG
jgi:predicted dehydrogenase